MSETEPVDDVISADDFERAEENWYQGHYGLRCEEAMERFFTYCRSVEQSFVEDLSECDGNGNYKVARSTAHRIKLLAGPNFRAVIEAYYKLHPWK